MTAAADASQSRPPATILIAEDQQTIRDVARRILESDGYTILTAANGQAAVDMVRARPNEIALVLLDMVMPQLSGLEAAVALRALQPNLRIVLMTGDSTQITSARNNASIDGFVLKPFRMQTLLAAVRAVLDGTAPTSSP